MKVRIDALDITVLRGGPAEVGQWATDHGFRLPPDAPEVLDFYAARSPIFLAAVFDADAAAARGPGRRRRHAGPHHDPDRQPVGPAAHPGARQDRRGAVQADVYLLTDRTPALLPAPDGTNGLELDHSAPRRNRCSPTCAPTAAWTGSRRRLADQGPDRRLGAGSSASTWRSTPPGPASHRG